MSTPPFNPVSHIGRALAREQPYRAFARHLEPVPEEASAPTPLDPGIRVVDEAVHLLAAAGEQLAAAQANVIAHLPEPVRLKLARQLLSTAEAAERALGQFKLYQTTGSIAAPRGQRSWSRKRRLKP